MQKHVAFFPPSIWVPCVRAAAVHLECIMMQKKKYSNAASQHRIQCNGHNTQSEASCFILELDQKILSSNKINRLPDGSSIR